MPTLLTINRITKLISRDYVTGEGGWKTSLIEHQKRKSRSIMSTFKQLPSPKIRGY